MTWVRLEDNVTLHPKILRLSDGAFRLWVNGLAFANRAATDGRLDKALVASLNHCGTWSTRQLVGFISELNGSLWIDRGDHYEIHDYEHHQAEAMKDRVERKKRYEREKKRKQREDDDRKKYGTPAIVPHNVPTGQTQGHHGESLRESSVPTRPVVNSLPTVENARATLGWSDIVETYSRIRSEAWQKKTGNPGGRWKPGVKDHDGVASALELFRDEPQPQAALEDSIRGFMRDTWATERDWPFSAWSRDPGRYRGKAVSGAVAGSTVDANAEHDACLLRAEKAALRGDTEAKEAELRKAAEIRKASRERLKQVNA